MKVAWVTPWDRVCGIADYSAGLHPAVRAALAADGGRADVVSLDAFPSRAAVVAELRRLAPDVVHFQHEYGVFGGKRPTRYWFPRLARDVADALPRARRVATAHCVLDADFEYPVRGRGAEAPLRWAANRFAMGPLRRLWGEATWGAQHAVVVHADLQVPTVRAVAPGARVERIAHYVPDAAPAPEPRRADGAPRTLVVFGFLAREKGQVLAVEALAALGEGWRLVLAGGTRPGTDAHAERACRRLAAEHGLADRCAITGYVERSRLDAVLADADLVLAPFLESTGSGSLTHALARGLPVLASDLPVTREIVERQPDALALFRAGDAADLARRVREVFDAPGERARLRAGALAYARAHGPAQIAARHVELYRSLA